MSDDKKAGCEPGAADAPILVTTSAAAPALAVTQLFDTGSNAPSRWPPNQPVQNVMAMVHSFGGAFSAYNAPPCIGQRVSAANNMALLDIIQFSYGGDGDAYFDLPDLRNRVAAGGTAVGAVTGNALTMTYMIAAEPFGWAGFPLLGMVALFAGAFAPSGWLVADGSAVSIRDYDALYSMIGAPFGGDGNVFDLPNLQGRAVIGVGAGAGRAPVTLGAVVESGPGAVPGLGLAYLICTMGSYPTPEGDASFPPNEATVGEVVAFAGPGLPVEVPGWALCDGALLPIDAANAPLYALLRTRFGGDGTANFALPDLRGRMIVGSPS